LCFGWEKEENEYSRGLSPILGAVNHECPVLVTFKSSLEENLGKNL